MDKGIGFSRTITLDWLDVVASLCIQTIEPLEIRHHLAETISGTVHGLEAQRKTIDVLTAIWLKTEKSVPQIRQQALVIFPTLSSPQERMWLHFGMSLVCYPFFRKCAAGIGQVARTQELITRKLIKDKIAGDYGHLGALDRSVERIIASLTNWGTLANTDQKQQYKIQFHSFLASENLQSWLLTCALYAHPSEGLPYNDLLHLPELYPFNLTIGVDSLRRDARFEVQRQGGGLEMVRSKK
ncbi:MAG: hypothetical protein NTW32_26240 [Chloroflexi bacterium]|nr:hypothetical protein [Chloroflexota bacterium]